MSESYGSFHKTSVTTGRVNSFVHMYGCSRRTWKRPFSCLGIFWQGEFLFGGEGKHSAYWSHHFFLCWLRTGMMHGCRTRDTLSNKQRCSLCPNMMPMPEPGQQKHLQNIDGEDKSWQTKIDKLQEFLIKIKKNKCSRFHWHMFWFHGRASATAWN